MALQGRVRRRVAGCCVDADGEVERRERIRCDGGSEHLRAGAPGTVPGRRTVRASHPRRNRWRGDPHDGPVSVAARAPARLGGHRCGREHRLRVRFQRTGADGPVDRARPAGVAGPRPHAARARAGCHRHSRARRHHERPGLLRGGAHRHQRRQHRLLQGAVDTFIHRASARVVARRHRSHAPLDAERHLRQRSEHGHHEPHPGDGRAGGYRAAARLPAHPVPGLPRRRTRHAIARGRPGAGALPRLGAGCAAVRIPHDLLVDPAVRPVGDVLLADARRHRVQRGEPRRGRRTIAGIAVHRFRHAGPRRPRPPGGAGMRPGQPAWRLP